MFSCIIYLYFCQSCFTDSRLQREKHDAMGSRPLAYDYVYWTSLSSISLITHHSGKCRVFRSGLFYTRPRALDREYVEADQRGETSLVWLLSQPRCPFNFCARWSVIHIHPFFPHHEIIYTQDEQTAYCPLNASALHGMGGPGG